MLPVISSSEMQWVDRASLRTRRWTNWDLLESVTDEMVLTLTRSGSGIPDFQRCVVLCGPGNNGADGYRVAEKLRARSKKQTEAVSVLPPSSPECKRAARRFHGKKWTLSRFSKHLAGKKQFDSQTLIVDAVFGNQGRRDLSPEIQEIFKKVRSLSPQIFRISLDLPSGVGENGVHPEAFQADLSLVVGYPREVLMKEEVAERAGNVLLVGTSLFKAPRFSVAQWIEDSDFHFQRPSPISYKKGKVGIVAGSTNSPGAAFLCAEAAHRTGVGYSTLFFAEPGKSIRIGMKEASFLYRLRWKLQDLMSQDALVFGPGGVTKAVPKALSKFPGPQVWDAEALRLLSRHRSPLMKVQKLKAWRSTPKRSRILLTPHLGEAARLSHLTVDEIRKNRVGFGEELSRSSGYSLYLKGAPGLLFWGDSSDAESRQPLVNYSLNFRLGRAGSGDVLSGILGGFLAQDPGHFRKSIVSGLVFQRTLASYLPLAAIASDQLNLFSESFKKLWYEDELS